MMKSNLISAEWSCCLEEIYPGFTTQMLSIDQLEMLVQILWCCGVGSAPICLR